MHKQDQIMVGKTELQEQVIRAIKKSQNRILLYAEAALPESQFLAFRKLVLDELGKSGAEGKINNLFRNGKGRHEK